MKNIFFLLAGCVLAVWPLFHPGLIPTHDGEYHLIRFYEFDKILRSGTLYPRWAPDLNFEYGVPLFTYNYPLPNYVASLLHALGASFLDSVKLNMVAATFVGAVCMYLFAKRYWGKLGGLVSSVFYTFAPYHFVDIYVRGSVGEVWALALFPGFLWAYTAFAQTKKPLYAAFSAIFLALTVFSHNIVGLMCFVFALTYCTSLIFQSEDKKYILLTTFYMLLISLGLSCIFWLPALIETKYVTGLQIYNIRQNFPDFFQLFFPSWGTGFFGTSLNNQMSVQIGVANLLAVAIGCFAFFKTKSKEGNRAALGFFLGWFMILFFLLLPVSYPIWKTVPLMSYFQFPWRFLSLVILICAFLAGSISEVKKPIIFSVILILIAVITTISYTQPAYYMLRNDNYYISRSNFIDGTNSPGNDFNTIWNKPISQRPVSLFLHTNGVQITHVKRYSPTDWSAKLTSPDKKDISATLSYFPSWNVAVDGKHQHTFPTNGLLSFVITPGQHTVHITFGQTPFEKFAMWVSVGSALFLLYFLLKKRTA